MILLPDFIERTLRWPSLEFTRNMIESSTRNGRASLRQQLCHAHIGANAGRRLNVEPVHQTACSDDSQSHATLGLVFAIHDVGNGSNSRTPVRDINDEGGVR